MTIPAGTLPAAIQTAVLTFGGDVDFFGSPVSVKVRVTPSTSLVWAATGQRILGFDRVFITPQSTPGQIELPVVDQVGWQNGAGLVTTMWNYRISAEYTLVGTSQTLKFDRVWQPVSGQDTVDFDSLPESAPTDPGTIPGPGAVTSVNSKGPGAILLDVGDIPGAVGLVNGKIDPALLPVDPDPSETIVQKWPAANQAAMLALTDATVGDIAIRADQDGLFYQLKALPPSTLGNWRSSTVTAGILLLNNKAPDGQGKLTLAPADIIPPAAPAADLATLQALVANLQSQVNALTTGTSNAALGARVSTLELQANLYDWIPIDQIAGADWDAKLAQFRIDAMGTKYGTYRMGILLRGNPTFRKPIQDFDGFAYAQTLSPVGLLNPEQTSKGLPGKVLINCKANGGKWRFTTTTVFNVYAGPGNFQSSDGAKDATSGVVTGTQYASSTGGNGLYSSVIEGQTWTGFKGVLGSSTEKYLYTRLVGRGDGSALACWDTPFHLGGGDGEFWLASGLNIGGISVGMGGLPLFWMDSAAKTDVGPLFLNDNVGASGLLVSGSLTQALNFYGLKSEGLNGAAGNRSDGATIRVYGGSPSFFGVWVAYGLGNPGANGRGETGQIEVTGSAKPKFYSPVFNRYDGQAESAYAAIAASGTSRVTVFGADVADVRSAASWTKKPWAKVAGSASIVCPDSSMIVGTTWAGAA